MGETITTEASALARIDADTGDFIEVTTRTGRAICAELYEVRVREDGSRVLTGWLLERKRGGQMVRGTDADGAYRVVCIQVDGRLVPQATVTPKRISYMRGSRHLLASHAVRVIGAEVPA